MSPPTTSKGKESAAARFSVGNIWSIQHFSVTDGLSVQLTRRGFSGSVAELLIFHPVDTVAKRLMSNKAKVAQRVYKFGGQPWFHDLINKHYKTSSRTRLGAEGEDDDAGHRGSLTGIGEVVLLPLDALKIKRQVNPEAFRGRGVIRIFMEEERPCTGLGLDNGTERTWILRTVRRVGSNEGVRPCVTDYSKATWGQNS
ncbi:putative mitochondrial carrier [Lyophyllum shimeji]|uniref:Mitochondrial carrier n=1 Tax=Lyophyllum shimeji TaxID=47721 RepID=A0A9P3UIK0_LYOSH|nr:putative mitochondrial carrier [Lyophyllum shimeji]